eukprot:TRINITY_DN201_c0_g1_i1.p1 TRINITY_DN201_c0_g1~~TRINITY_DN201_c0_g1_i1.p1  ORF type:complete len:440 (+),score=160.35 TRINITY_DN201_c0_g1_i1:162-1481(+)
MDAFLKFAKKLTKYEKPKKEKSSFSITPRISLSSSSRHSSTSSLKDSQTKATAVPASPKKGKAKGENGNGTETPRSHHTTEVVPSTCKAFEELPKSVQGSLMSVGVTEATVNENWDTIWNILLFQRYISLPKEEDEKREKGKDKYYAEYDPVVESQLVEDLPKEKFKVLNQVGKGGFGTVYKAKQGSKTIAIKKASHKSEREKRRNLHEISFLKKIRHQNLVKVFSSHIVDGDIWIAMEFMEGGTLSEAVQRQELKTDIISFVAHGLLEALCYLHENKIAHRDLKSANIMLTINAEVKIIDFGLCCYIDQPRNETVGSPFWMAPEMIMHKPHSFPVDIWSFGISLLEMANGEAPYRDNALKAMTTIGLHGITDPFNDPSKWHRSFLDFIDDTLKYHPDQRPTAAQLLQHGFIKIRCRTNDMRALLLRIFTVSALDTLSF